MNQLNKSMKVRKNKSQKTMRNKKKYNKKVLSTLNLWMSISKKVC